MKKAIPALALSSIMAFSAHGAENKNFDYVVDRFADIEVLRYEVPGFQELTPARKAMIYYLNQAALVGRDIIWDQNCRYNLPIRTLLEGIYTNYKGDRNSKDFKAFGSATVSTITIRPINSYPVSHRHSSPNR